MSVEFTQRQKIFYEKLIHLIFFPFLCEEMRV